MRRQETGKKTWVPFDEKVCLRYLFSFILKFYINNIIFNI